MGGRGTIEEIDDARRRGELTWEQYAALLKGHPDGARLFREFGVDRDRQGRLKELKDLGVLGG